jgi:hypothetical protein
VPAIRKDGARISIEFTIMPFRDAPRGMFGKLGRGQLSPYRQRSANPEGSRGGEAAPPLQSVDRNCRWRKCHLIRIELKYLAEIMGPAAIVQHLQIACSSMCRMLE